MWHSDPHYMFPGNAEAAHWTSTLACFVLDSLADAKSQSATSASSCATPTSASPFQVFFRDCCDGMWAAVFSNEKPIACGHSHKVDETDTSVSTSPCSIPLTLSHAPNHSEINMTCRENAENVKPEGALLTENEAMVIADGDTAKENIERTNSDSSCSSTNVMSIDMPRNSVDYDARMLRVCEALSRTSKQQQWTLQWRAFVAPLDAPLAHAEQFLTMLFDVIVSAILRYRVHCVLTTFSKPHHRVVVTDVLLSKEAQIQQTGRAVFNDEIQTALQALNPFAAAILSALFLDSSYHLGSMNTALVSASSLASPAYSLSNMTPPNVSSSSIVAHKRLPLFFSLSKHGPTLSSTTSSSSSSPSILSSSHLSPMVSSSVDTCCSTSLLPSQNSGSPLSPVMLQQQHHHHSHPTTAPRHGGPMVASVYRFLRRADGLLSLYLRSCGHNAAQNSQFLQLCMHNAVLQSHWKSVISDGAQRAAAGMSALIQEQLQQHVQLQQQSLALFSAVLTRLFHYRIQRSHARRTLQNAIISAGKTRANSSPSLSSRTVLMRCSEFLHNAASSPIVGLKMGETSGQAVNGVSASDIPVGGCSGRMA